MRKVLVAVLLSLLLFCWGCPSSSQPQDSDSAPVPAEKKESDSACSDITSAWQSIEGYPYVWGGESITEGGFDCSGSIYFIQKAIGHPTPRTTSRKYYLLAEGEPTPWQNGECGDWIWWTFSPNRPYGHIGMHTIFPHVWQSGSSTGPIQITLASGNYWTEHFTATKKAP